MLGEPFGRSECGHLCGCAQAQFAIKRYQTALMLMGQRRVSGIGSSEKKPAGKIRSAFRSGRVQAEKLHAWSALETVRGFVPIGRILRSSCRTRRDLDKREAGLDEFHSLLDGRKQKCRRVRVEGLSRIRSRQPNIGINNGFHDPPPVYPRAGADPRPLRQSVRPTPATRATTPRQPRANFPKSLRPLIDAVPGQVGLPRALRLKYSAALWSRSFPAFPQAPPASRVSSSCFYLRPT